MEQSQIENVLKGCEFFKEIEDSTIKEIAKICKTKSYENGSCVFRQGDFGENLYVIADGRIFLERATDLGTRKGRVVIETLGKGRVLGCWSTLLGECHNLMSSAVCQQPTEVVVMKGAELRDLMLSDLNIGFKVLERFCYLLRNRIIAAYGVMDKV